MGTSPAEFAQLLHESKMTHQQKDMLRLALFLMANAGCNEGMNALVAGDTDKLVQLVKDHFMKDIPEERRTAAEEAVHLFSKYGNADHIIAAHDIKLAMKAYMEINRFNPVAYIKDEDFSMNATLWYGGYIAGIRQERQRKRK